MNTSPPTSLPSTTAGRLFGMARLAWAAVLLGAPAKVIGAMGGQADPKAVTVARILGARHALQGAVEITTWPRWRRTGSAVDAIHSVTAAALAATDNRRRHVAIADTLVAAAFAGAGAAAGSAGSAGAAAAGAAR